MAYIDKILELGELTETRPVTTPATQDPVDTTEELPPDLTTKYRTVVGQLLWMGDTHPEILYAVKEAARHNQAPRAGHWCQVKRILRYLRGVKEMVLHLDFEEDADMAVQILADASWAPGTDEKRKSTTGEAIFLQGVLLHARSATQQTIALSSCESELLAATDAATKGLWLTAILKELGFQPKVPATVHGFDQLRVAPVPARPRQGETL